MYTRQDAAKDAASTNISREHAEKMIQMAQGKYVTPTKSHGMKQISRLSPQQIASRQEFAFPGDTAQPLYSVEQVQALLSAQTEENMQAGGQPQTLSAAESPPTTIISAGTVALSTSRTTNKLEVICEASGSPLTIILRLQHQATIQDVNQELATKWNISTPEAFKLHFEREDGAKVTITHIDDVWDLLQTRGRWVFLSITRLTPQQARQEHAPSPAISENVSRRLSYGMSEADAPARLTQALRLQQLERAVVEEFKSVVATAVKPYGDKVGKSGRSHAETFYNALRVTEDLTKAFERTKAQIVRRDTPIEEQQLLQWFIEAILDRLEDDVKKRWQGQDDTERREASYYSSWPQFKARLFSLMRNVLDYTPAELMDQLPNLVAPANCASRNDLWVAIEQVQTAAKSLAAMKAVEATAQIEMSTVKFLAESLTPPAKQRIIEALATKHRAEASEYYELKEHPPLTAYPSRCIKAVMLGLDDFDGDWHLDWRSSPTKTKDPPKDQPDNGGGNGSQRSEKQKRSNERTASPRIRVLKRNQQTLEFPYYLKDVPDAGERARQEKHFVANTLLDWKCHKCGGQGHTQDICPQFFNLDGLLIERNPKSFFFGVRPPVPVLALRTAVAKVMPVLETGASVPSASIELDPQELQEFHAWRAGQRSGN